MRDWCFQPDCLQRFIVAWPGAETHPLDDVGHWVIEDAPEESVQIVTRFLERTQCAPPTTPLNADTFCSSPSPTRLLNR
jgi:hypothetical protein